MKNFFSKKSFGFYFTLASVLFELLACILFAASRENKYAFIVAIMVIGFVAACVVAIKHYPLTEIVPMVFMAASAGLLVWVLLNNLSDIFAKNNVIGLSGGFITSLVFSVIAMICSVGGFIAKQEK